MKKIAIIGGSYLQLPIVSTAKEMGLEVHCFAWEEGAVCKDVCDFFYPISIVEKEEILKRCREIGIDAVTTIASDTAVVTVNYVAEKLRLIANPDSYTSVTTNKYLMRQCFMEHGIPTPRFVSSAKLESQPSLLDLLEMPLIVKPTDRSGSRGVEKVNSINFLPKAIERARQASFENEAIIEEFVEGREISVESISFEGHHYVLQITDKVTTGSPFFVELEHHQPSTLPQEVQDQVRTIVRKALDALHIQYGSSHSELKITPEGSIKVIEIGARMGGDFIGSHLVKLSTGYDFLRAVVEVSLGTFQPPRICDERHSGVLFLSKETEALLPIIEHAERYPEIVDAALTSTELRNIECSGDRSGYAIYQADQKLTLEHFTSRPRNSY